MRYSYSYGTGTLPECELIVTSHLVSRQASDVPNKMQDDMER